MAEVTYRDIDLSFARNPLSGDVSALTEERAVMQQMENVILSRYGSVPYMEYIGSDVDGFLFELFDQQVKTLLERIITEAIKEHVERVELIDVVVNERQPNHELYVDIIFKLRNDTVTRKYSVKLRKEL